MKNKNMVLMLVLHFVIFIYSVASVLCKVTAIFLNEYGLMNWRTILSCFMVFAFMGLYAILWQKVIKKMELSVAYMNKGITVVWSLVWSAFLFHENVGVNHIIGTILIVLGIVILAGEKDE